MLCLERVNVSLRDSEVLELNEGIAGDSGDEEEKSEEQSPVTSTSLRHKLHKSLILIAFICLHGYYSKICSLGS